MRSRVNERLQRATQYPVTLIIAPAGFGKSWALRDFLEASRIDAVRYDVRREDNTLLEFVHRFSEAVRDVAPTAGASFAAMQERVLAASEPVRQISDWLYEHLKTSTCTIVIDDLHFAAADQSAIALLADVIERTCDRIRWIVAARTDVGLPVATWMAYGRMDLPVGEEDLRFTTDEALATAETTATGFQTHEVETLRQLTEGWPVALTIALRMRTHSRDLRTASFSTRDMVYRYLAEQVFAALSPLQRTFALATCVFSTFDTHTCERLGANLEFLSDLRAKIAFLNEVAPGEYRYHDLFRDFLETELRRSGERQWTQCLCDGAALLEDRGDFAGALTLYTKAKAYVEMRRLIERHGFDLFERGETERVAAAIEAMPEHDVAENASLSGMQAMIESSRGRFDFVQGRFLAAIDGAREDFNLQIFLVHRYAIELVRHSRDSIAFLEPYATRQELSDTQRVLLLGTLATAYSRAGRHADAMETIERALARLAPTMTSEMQARLYQQAAFVYHQTPYIEKARAFAEAAIALGQTHALYDVMARAYTVLYYVRHNVEDDPLAALTALDRTEENARKAGSTQAHLFALIAAYDIRAELGDEAALERLDEELAQTAGALEEVRAETLAPALALRAAWSKDFARAAQLLKGTAARMEAPDRRALRAAEAALYAACAAQADAAEDEVRIATTALEQMRQENRRTIRAHIFLAAAELVRGHSSSAHRHLSDAEHALRGGMARLRVLAAAVRQLYRVQLGQLDYASAYTPLEKLREHCLGGIARLLEALPLSSAQGAVTLLTAAEREILQLLVSGASTKEVANQTGRSPHTVDTHIRSICRKLNCSGRREAVALATSQGWVHT